jgi:hypothetical protein
MSATTTKKRVHGAEYGNAVIASDSLAVVAGDVAAASVNKLCPIAGGTTVHRVVIKNTDLDSNGTPTLTAKIGFSPIDGSAAAAGQDTAVAANGAWGQAAATTTYEIFPPVFVDKDSYLTLVVGTGAATGAAGTIYAKVEGEAVGLK